MTVALTHANCPTRPVVHRSQEAEDAEVEDEEDGPDDDDEEEEEEDPTVTDDGAAECDEDDQAEAPAPRPPPSAVAQATPPTSAPDGAARVAPRGKVAADGSGHSSPADDQATASAEVGRRCKLDPGF